MTRMVNAVRVSLFTDLSSETCLPLARLGAELGIPHATLRTWFRRGCRGVKLEVDTRGGRLVSSREAVDRFNDRIRSGWGAGMGQPVPGRADKRRAERAHREADEKLKKRWGLN